MNNILMANQLVEKTKAIIYSEEDAEQVIVAYSESENMYIRVNRDVMSGLHADEEQFIQELIDNQDTALRYVVCMWKGFTLDLPSIYVRKRLIEIDSKNAYAQMILDNKQTKWMKTHKSTMP